MKRIKEIINKILLNIGFYPLWTVKHIIRGKSNKGYCLTCKRKTVFIELRDWLRDNYQCAWCRSIPRQRALINALERFYPNWRDLHVHESSPGGISSDLIRKECNHYSDSQYFLDVPLGQIYKGTRCENLENLTFENNTFDLLVSQDVFEHVLHPADAFKEIYRVLKPGGAHVFTMPWYPKLDKTLQRAKAENGAIVFLEEPVYHGNPINNEGSLVTFDWGKDFVDFIFNNSGLNTTIYLVKDRTLGLDAEFLEVFISRKNND